VAGAFRHEIVGKSEATRQLRERVLQLKGSRFPILITGESGTGKESIARMLHKIERPGRPFVIVNCGAIAENLVESELFGHVRGAFTGAVRDQAGKFELAHQGDIFLDEFGELPLAAQVKLLRVLQDGSFHRVGDRSERRVSVRVIAATNRDLGQLVAEGKFREDLYFRVNVIPIHATALRERPEDIADIARFLLTIHGKGRFTIAPEAVDALSAHHWPGNVRELGNAIERAIIEAKIRGSKQIELVDFTSIFQLGMPGDEIKLPARASEVSVEGFEEYVRQAERKYLARALGYFGGSVIALSEHMSISRSALFRRVSNAGLAAGGRRPGLTTAVGKEPADAAAHR
jgi:transcriptional regulator with PAS, ATPase and Fis domain